MVRLSWRGASALRLHVSTRPPMIVVAPRIGARVNLRKTNMTLFARILIGLIALFFLVWAFRFFFMPEAIATEFSIAPLGTAGLSTIRGDLGGAFFAIGAFSLLGLRAGGAWWLYAAAAVIGAVAIGRAIGFAFDGMLPTTVVPFVIEVVFVVVLLFGARTLQSAGR
jgi:hypothetical protein